MNWLNAFLTSSVGRKYVMGLTGLFLCLFLVVHLAGNLLLYVGPEAYNAYAHKLHDNPEFLIAAEILLYAAFLFHIYLAVVLTRANKSARDRSYAQKQSKIEGRALLASLSPENTMFLTGFIGLLFIIVHVSDFKFELFWGEAVASLEPFEKAQLIVADVTRGAIYLVGAIVLGIHVSHGFQSAFQSLGFHHNKYTPSIRCCSWLFGVIVALGFGSFPVLKFLGLW